MVAICKIGMSLLPPAFESCERMKSGKPLGLAVKGGDSVNLKALALILLVFCASLTVTSAVAAVCSRLSVPKLAFGGSASLISADRGPIIVPMGPIDTPGGPT
jgi:hypothetical protein